MRNFSIGQTFISYDRPFCTDYDQSESVFTWNDLVSAAKSSKGCTPKYFCQILSFTMNLGVGQTFTSYYRP